MYPIDALTAPRRDAGAGTVVRAVTLMTLIVVAAVLVACGQGDVERADRAGADTLVDTSQDAFWEALSSPCGQAFPGRLVVDRPDRDMLAGDEELIAHWVRCEDDLLHIAFHIGHDGGEGEWDRSRTWVLTRDERGIELRHDHRHADGTEEEETWYGGRTIDRGTPQEQWFLYEERRGPDGEPLGWRLEIIPGERYTYGTIRGDDYTWRLDFDLSEPVPAPPAAWGHEG